MKKHITSLPCLKSLFFFWLVFAQVFFASLAYAKSNNAADSIMKICPSGLDLQLGVFDASSVEVPIYRAQAIHDGGDLSKGSNPANTITKVTPLKSIAFYYGHNPPMDELHTFDVAVVNDAPDINPQMYNDANSSLFAYVSIGELLPEQVKNHMVPSKWILGKNTAWKTAVTDLANPDFQHWLIAEQIEPLWKKGYRGFFFDTLDSYFAATKDPIKIKAEQAGLVSIIKAIKKQHPTVKIITNRGFEVIPSVKNDIYAVAAESLYQRWNQAAHRYEVVPPNDRAWLLNQFKQVKALGLPCISIDYVPSSNMKQAQKTAALIEKMGIIPWVADKDLNNLGISTLRVIPRKIFILYNPVIDAKKFFTPQALTVASFPLEYMGYVPELHSTADPLPDYPLEGRYAGIIVWAYSTNPKLLTEINHWLVKQRKLGIPILFMASISFLTDIPNYSDYVSQTVWNIHLATNINPKKPQLHIANQSPDVGYEVKPYPQNLSFIPVVASNSKVLLQINNQHDQQEDAIAITPWGGYALDPFVTLGMPNGLNRWIINPFDFFVKALRLKPLPIPDTTTENGRRLMMVHVDGDGFPSQTEGGKHTYAGLAMNDQIFKRYRIPTDVSIIEGEIGPEGLFPQQSPEMEKTARIIFAQPWIEIATHTFSHPFNWQLMYGEKKNGIYNLPIKNYKYSIEREIIGSTNYINKNLAPKGKRCKMIFWSGQTNLDANILKLSYEAHLNNLNGGAEVVSPRFYTLTNVDPLGVNFGGYFQVFASNANEDLYTNLWRGPFYGFVKVISAFQLTNQPHRYKPIDIYYHFYAATKIASIKALNTIYKWALSQHVFNIFESEYSEKVLDFNRTDLAFSEGTQGYIIKNRGALRELRVAKSQGYPDLVHSENIVGYYPYGDDNYIHLGNQTVSRLVLTQRKPQEIYLYQANGRVTEFQREGKGVKLSLSGYMPLKFTLANMKTCSLFKGENMIAPMQSMQDGKTGLKSYQFTETISNGMEIRC